MISSNSDEDVAKSVVEAIGLVGDDGTIITEDGKERETKVEMREGFPIRKGLNTLGAVQELFINHPEDQECVFDTPYVLLYDGDVNLPQDLGVCLGNMFQKMGDDIKPVVVVAHKFSPQVIQVISFNVKQNRAAICLLETVATAQPNSKHHLLHDLAAFTGATVLDPLTKPLLKAVPDDLGACVQTRIGRYQSVFMGMNDEDAVKERIEVLKKQMEVAESDFDAEIIKERVSQLSGGIATIYVGGSSELEIREKKHRIEDTINAVRSAIELGVVPGGGTALLAVTPLLTKEQTPARSILSSAFTVPFTRIMSNSGISDSVIMESAMKVLKSVPEGEAMPKLIYDSLKHEFSDPFVSGIIDPVKVTISALNNALSISKMLMTLGGAVVIPRDKEEEQQAEMAAQAFARQMEGT
jgi:chaperonin GroEL